MIFTNFKLAQNTLTILVSKVKEGYSLIGYKSHRICLPKEISPDKSTDISFRLSQGKLKPVKSLCFFWEDFTADISTLSSVPVEIIKRLCWQLD